jgi:cellulose biosynthesis protein BcsQ
VKNNARGIRCDGRRISVYNHKGGVGKTTLTFNIAAAIAALGKRVLLVDADPQCNLTSYMIEESVIDDLLDNSDTKHGETLWSAVRPVVEATGDVREIKPLETYVQNVFLLPGDVRLSEFEAELNDFWGQCLQRKGKGFRGTTALSHLVTLLVRQLQFDFVFYDSGPNIGPLNRSILLDCDYFVVPVAYDLFSVRALKTLGRTLTNWIQDWETIADLAPTGTYLLAGRPIFAGYLPQNFGVYGGQPVSHHLKYASKIDRRIQSEVIAVLRSVDGGLAPFVASRAKLGEVQDFKSLIPASQSDGVPLWRVDAGTPALRNKAKDKFQSIANRLISLTS